MRRSLLLSAALVLLALPVSADAAVRHVMTGAGFGHGIGMSQYGAYGFALVGAKYKRILSHYYKGTRLEKATGRLGTVRVLLQPYDPYIRFRGATRAAGVKLNPRTTYVAKQSGSGISLRTAKGRRVTSTRGALRADAGGEAPVRLLGPADNGYSDSRYRGAIEVNPSGPGVTAINVLDIDLYVKGVVAGEMPSSWPLEALKAQAVTARTYALATRKTDQNFDLYADTRSQVYRGVIGEAVSSNRAVDRTSGEILTYGGQPAVTYYFSTSGGRTESIQYSFIGALSKPWLVSVPDPNEYRAGSPYHVWDKRRYSSSALDAAFGTPGSFVRLKVLSRGVSPRVVRARAIGTAGSRVLTGPDVRARLGLPDTWFTLSTIRSFRVQQRSARPAAWGGAPRIRALGGEFYPSPKRRKLAVERRIGARDWRTIDTVRTTRSGRYRVTVDRPGVYRVRSGTVAGPNVRLR